ncbi:hypothetical protein P691DRAFT_783414 [Macrolepiota fuliginosa MF-IS2]|uniref:Uncharacterized protein n=1 Tax=Macrolepiota fuliginosa MF-IS2 TaxID=1400762 RepID=A0A9P6C2U5_9AGAR|nr:hypothetical protein P691DRAFT_783414 [Macrolepiota fuliginosa MF-IS2]
MAVSWNSPRFHMGSNNTPGTAPGTHAMMGDQVQDRYELVHVVCYYPNRFRVDPTTHHLRKEAGIHNGFSVRRSTVENAASELHCHAITHSQASCPALDYTITKGLIYSRLVVIIAFEEDDATANPEVQVLEGVSTPAESDRYARQDRAIQLKINFKQTSATTPIKSSRKPPRNITGGSYPIRVHSGSVERTWVGVTATFLATNAQVPKCHRPRNLLFGVLGTLIDLLGGEGLNRPDKNMFYSGAPKSLNTHTRHPYASGITAIDVEGGGPGWRVGSPDYLIEEHTWRVLVLHWEVCGWARLFAMAIEMEEFGCFLVRANFETREKGQILFC